MEILKCENLSKIYGSGQTKVTALDRINLSVEKGEFTAIIGASGSGKSTLLHLLGGVDRPSAGKIWIEGTDIATLNEKQLSIFRRRKVGLVYQFYNLIPSIDVSRNILLPMLLDRQKPDERRFEELVGILGLKDRLTHLPGQLSGGQQQRAAIARALIYRPAILLADEPTGNLDKKNSEEILGLLKLSNKKYRQTILLITHDERIALEADRIITIEDGRILSDSPNQTGAKNISSNNNAANRENSPDNSNTAYRKNSPDNSNTAYRENSPDNHNTANRKNSPDNSNTANRENSPDNHNTANRENTQDREVIA